MRKVCPIAILSTTNPTWATLELNPCLYGKKLATSHLRYNMASLLSHILRIQGKIIYVGTPTSHSISSYSIPFHLTALLPLSIPQSTHTNLVNCSLTAKANHSLTPSFSVCFHKQSKQPPASVLHPTSHTYQLCQPTNGRAGWTACDRNKRSPFGPTRFSHSERSNQQHTSRKENCEVKQD